MEKSSRKVYGELETDVESVIDYANLNAQFDALRTEYENGDPFPHIVLDNFFARDIAAHAASHFPAFRKRRLAKFLEARSYGLAVDADPVFATMFDALFDDRFTSWLERLTGIEELAGDREFVGAGLHQGASGSFLHLHADHNTHPNDTLRYRRINVLVYMNATWKSRWNGDLQLWDRFGATCRKTITPAFNRCVIMEVSDEAFHGYDRLKLPPGETRKLLAAYFYARVPGSRQSSEPHGTILRHPRNANWFSRFDHAFRRALLWRIENSKKKS